MGEVLMRINGYNINEELTRWEHAYSYLKAVNGKTSLETIINVFEDIDIDALKDGIDEYNMMAEGSNGYFEPSILKTK